MIELALYEPEIPPNTGNIIRLCANAGVGLHLIHPLGFAWDHKQLQRAGLDYHEFVDIQHHESAAAFFKSQQHRRIMACSTKGTHYYHQIEYATDDILLMGPETRGLPASVLDSLPAEQVIKIPMQSQSRSLNLSNATAIILYRALLALDHFPC